MTLSVIIPAFNEEKRLPSTLAALAAEKERLGIGEVIVVDDGSRDDTAQKAQHACADLPCTVIRLPENRGKGAAVREGMMRASGDLFLLYDADGATPAEDIADLLTRRAETGADVVIGSRMLPGRSVVSMSAGRRIIGFLFHLLCLPLLPGIEDASCGCKLFTRDAARALFPRQRYERFAHDIEILLLARRNGYRIEEVPVSWRAVDGSKVRILRDGVEMFVRVMQLYARTLTKRL